MAICVLRCVHICVRNRDGQCLCIFVSICVRQRECHMLMYTPMHVGRVMVSLDWKLHIAVLLQED